jgi:hypothetical protein
MDAIKCTFYDISLDYIKIYEPIAASLLCDRMEEMMAQTGKNGFHYVDEVAHEKRHKDTGTTFLSR